jgi:hypothetical protein
MKKKLAIAIFSNKGPSRPPVNINNPGAAYLKKAKAWAKKNKRTFRDNFAMVLAYTFET